MYPFITNLISGRAAVVPLGVAEPNDFFVISTTSIANYTNDPINLIELNPLILLASSATELNRLLNRHPCVAKISIVTIFKMRHGCCNTLCSF
jgi:hypothetical protein